MDKKTKEMLCRRAKEILKPMQLNTYKGNRTASASAALITKNGNVYTGISLVTACSLGFCAETAAIAEMLKAGETQIAGIVALIHEGKIIPPCGRCRELIFQVDKRNLDTEVIISSTRTKRLQDMLVDIWVEQC